ncbi:TolC family outer membrane protein [Nereida sp. MMG025]|uniref:TolC family outer membrane protein n=1 Tax=Nereida sp. MMG025 TaxID=2909981 RepID=UPI001F011358|nr:TolC family outer membrane protein [Nereida sp. MMG025]MCF6445067.1 TolC family outer membrane protein [Nereida sp. MMG025]
MIAQRLNRHFASAVLAATLFVAPAAQAETLRDALVAAYKHSGLLDQQRAVLRAADEGVAQSMALLRPVFSYTAQVTASDASGSFNWGRTFTLNGEITVYDNGRSKIAQEQAKEQVLAAREALLRAEQQVLGNAIAAYLDVRTQTQLVGLRQANLRLIGQELRAAQDRFDVGEVTRTDVALAEARLASARGQLAAAQGQLQIAKEAYANAVGRRPGNLAPVAAVKGLPKSKSAAVRIAERENPLVREAQRNVTVQQLGIARAEAALGLTGTLRGSLGTDDDQDTTTSLSLSLNQPIYSGGQLSSLIRQAKANRDAAAANVHVTLHNVREGVGNAYAQLAIARAQIEATDRQVRAAQTAFNGVREEATLGARTTLDVLDAEQELFDARNQRITALIAEREASYGVLQAMGLLTASHLKLGIRTYDPTAYYNLVKDGPTAGSKQGQQLDRVLRSLSRD